MARDDDAKEALRSDAAYWIGQTITVMLIVCAVSALAVAGYLVGERDRSKMIEAQSSQL